MSTPLSAIVIGAGMAGEGHTLALRHWGVHVAAICARDATVVRRVADRLAIPDASTDWRRTVEQVRPDIVALATPAALRGEVVDVATAQGCHLYCDKPLATTAGEARRLYQLVESAGIKHAYAATQCYDPGLAWLGELIRDNAIGPVQEIESTLRVGFPALAPWTWWDDLTAGGGMLNNIFTHMLGMLHTVTGGEIVQVMGAARAGRQQAPVIADVHDFRAIFTGEKNPTPEEAARLEWRACDADGAFNALVGVRTVWGEVTATVGLSPLATAPWPRGWRLYGDAGTLLAEGTVSAAVSRLRGPSGDREPLPTPQRLLDDLPQVGDDGTNKWAALARDFVADVRGQAHRPYLTFREGWRFQEAIDAIRSGSGWTTLPL